MSKHGDAGSSTKRKIDAARAYDRAAWELFGPHAYLNFPPASQSNQERLAA